MPRWSSGELLFPLADDDTLGDADGIAELSLGQSATHAQKGEASTKAFESTLFHKELLVWFHVPPPKYASPILRGQSLNLMELADEAQALRHLFGFGGWSKKENCFHVQKWPDKVVANEYKTSMKYVFAPGCALLLYKPQRSALHDAVRVLLARMNIALRELRSTRAHAVCCGDSFYGLVPVDGVRKQMMRRAAQMPVEDVVVYCVSCVKSMFTGGKRARYLLDLIFGEPTVPGTLDPDAWHKQIDDFTATH
jgi:hypothetical protein